MTGSALGAAIDFHSEIVMLLMGRGRPSPTLPRIDHPEREGGDIRVAGLGIAAPDLDEGLSR